MSFAPPEQMTPPVYSKFPGAALALGPNLRGLKLRSWNTSRSEALSRVPPLVAKRHRWNDLVRSRRFIYSAAAQPGETPTLHHRHRIPRLDTSLLRRHYSSAMASATNFFEFKALDCKLSHANPSICPNHQPALRHLRLHVHSHLKTSANERIFAHCLV